MKAKTIKTLILAMTLTTMTVTGTAYVSAEAETTAEDTETADNTETADEDTQAADDSAEATDDSQSVSSNLTDSSVLWGAWRNDSNDPTLFFPDGFIYERNYDEVNKYDPYMTYEADGDSFTFSFVNDEDQQSIQDSVGDFTISGVLRTIEDADLTEDNESIREGCNAEVGKDKLFELTLSYTDNSDPLAPKEIEEKNIFFKCQNIVKYLRTLFLNNSWNIGDKTLTIEPHEGMYDGDLNLNNGDQTGKFSVNTDNSVTFNWEGGAVVTYDVVSVDQEQVVLKNKTDDSELVLTYAK